MKKSSPDSSVWTRGRFVGVVASLFILQAGLIVLFGSRAVRNAGATAPSTQFRALAAPMSEEELRQIFFASDPAVFAWPSAHGFSGRAWMDQPPAEFQSTNQLEAPLWLTLDKARPGPGIGPLNPANASAPLALARLDLPQLEPLPVFLPPEIIPTQSVFRIEGEVGGRLLGAAPALREWPGAQLLTNTVVQIAVDRAGDVMATRLLSRCGSADADGDALAKARALRFRPSADARTPWSRAIFQWQTTAPAPAGTPP